MKDGFDLLSALDDSQWLELILHNPNQSIPEGAFIPKLPPDSVQLAFNGSAGETTVSGWPSQGSHELRCLSVS